MTSTVGITHEEFAALARLAVERAYGASAGERPWLSASPPDSYHDPDQRVSVAVLQGSPPKGLVVAAPYFVLALGASGTVLRRFESWHTIRHLKLWERKALIDLRGRRS